jgi:hypothetical protein
MALRDKLDETKLRSLTYGDNTPYVTVDINTQQVTSNGRILKVSNDGTMLNSALIDKSRITAVIGDKPWWASQQIAIQAMNSRANFGFVEGKIKPTFTSDQQYTPLNTLAQVALNGVGGHIERKGLIPGDITNNLLGTGTYEAIKKREIDLADVTKNPLVTFYKNLLIPSKSEKTLNTLSQTKVGNFVKSAISLFVDPNQPIYQYLGGPNSIFGVGTTTIRRYYNTGNKLNIKSAPDKPTLDIRAGGTIITDPKTLLVEGLSPTYVANLENDSSPTDFSDNIQSNLMPLNAAFFEPTTNPLFNIYVNNASTVTSADINGNYNINNSSLLTNNPSITYNNGFTTMSFSSPNGWYGMSREVRVGSDKKDQINLTPLFTTNGEDSSDRIKINNSYYNIKDLVNFRIEAIQSDTLDSTWMVFRAFLNDLSDQVTSEWNGTKYIGRAEKFYTYGGFDRTINVNFKVAALSADEMRPMYQKLNYLMSNMMGDYNGGIMRGPMSRMTIGNYINRQPGVFTSLTYKVVNDSPWEVVLYNPVDATKKDAFITDDKIPNQKSTFQDWNINNNSTNIEQNLKQLVLPHVIEVSLTFIPIGAETNGVNLLPQRSADQSNIAQANKTIAKPLPPKVEKEKPVKKDPDPIPKKDPDPIPVVVPPNPNPKPYVGFKQPDIILPRDNTRAVVGTRSPNFTAKVGSTYTLDGKQYVFGGRYKTRGFDPLEKAFYGGGAKGAYGTPIGPRPDHPTW